MLKIVIALCCVIGALSKDRLPPNVNPNHYQAVDGQPQYAPPPEPHRAQQHQQQQQQQMHHPPPPPPPQQQQHQQQRQQPPPQQQQQQQQMQQGHHQQPSAHVAAHGAGGHHHGGRPLDKQHMEAQREDMGHHFDMPVDTSKMTDQELQFHYFKMHDADNNNMLDGLELVKSLIHWHDPKNHDPNTGVPPPEPKIFPDSELENMIDPILKADDKNGDGFIDYLEFVKAQEAAAAAANAPKQ